MQNVVRHLTFLIFGSALVALTGCKNPLGQDQLLDPNFHPGIYLSLSDSTLTVSSPNVASGASVSFALQLKDQNGANFTDAKTIVFSVSGGTSTGTIGSVTAQGDGLYTASFLGTSAGSALTVSATVDGEVITSALPTVTVVAGNYSLSQSTVTVSAASVASSSAVNLTLTVKDSLGNQLSSGGLTVSFTNSGGTSTGTISAVTDNSDGTYTATFTGVTAGTATTIHAAIGASSITSSLPTVTVVPGPFSASLSTLTASASSALVSNAITLTLTLIDAHNNNVTSGGATVVFSNSGGTSTGTFSSVTDNGDGTYSATFTGTSGGTATTIHASVNATAITSTLPSITILNNLSISSVSPASSFLKGGKTITINGAGFQSGITVAFGGVSCGSINIVSEAQLTCVNPLKATPAQVNVLLTNTNSQTATLTNGFEYKSDLFTTASTLSGNQTYQGDDDGTGASVRFNMPTKIINYNNDDFYISDSHNNVIRKYTRSTGMVTTIAGKSGEHGSTDGTGSAARFYEPQGLAIVGTNMYVADTSNGTIRKIDLTNYAVTTIAGVVGGGSNTNNAVGLSATFVGPSSLDTDGTDLYVATGNGASGNAIKKISLSGTNPVTTVKGGYTNGLVDILYSGGVIYYTMSDSNVYKLDVGTSTDTLVAGQSAAGYIQDGVGTNGWFTYPGGLAKLGNTLYVGDPGNYAIRAIDLTTNTVSTLAGQRTGSAPTLTGVSGNTDGVGLAASLAQVTGMTLYNSGGTQELYFMNFTYNNLRKLNLTTNQVTTVAGKVGN